MSLADNYRLIRNRIEENQLNYWRCYQSMQYLSEIDDLRSFISGYTNWRFETLTARKSDCLAQSRRISGGWKNCEKTCLTLTGTS